MKQLLLTFCTVIVLAALPACAAGSSSSGGSGYSGNRISAEEMAESTANNAFELIQRRRPQWLRVRGQSTFTGQEGVRVYVNGQPRGGIQSLEQVLVREITLIQYLDAATATQRFGTGNTAGAIMIEVQ